MSQVLDGVMTFPEKVHMLRRIDYYYVDVYIYINRKIKNMTIIHQNTHFNNAFIAAVKKCKSGVI